MTQGVFRDEALKAKSTPTLGGPFVEYPLRLSRFALAAVAALLVGFIAAHFIQLQDRSYVSGITEPDVGLIDVFPEHPGMVTSMLIKVGGKVEADEPLAQITVEPHSHMTERAAMASRERLESLRESLGDTEGHKARIAELSAIIQQTEKAISSTELAIRVAADLARLAKDKYDRANTLAASGTISKDALADRESAALEAEFRLHTLERDLDRLRLEMRAGQSRLNSEIAGHRERTRALERDIGGEEERQSTQTEAIEVEVHAPVEGVVTAVTYKPGQYADGSRPIASILPESATMWCVLLVPARELTQVKPGQSVSLRYAAFPHSRYGSYDGLIRIVETSPVVPPSKLNEQAMYRVYVEPLDRSIRTIDGDKPIVPGMAVEAVLWFDKQSALSKLLEPLIGAIAHKERQ